MKIWLLQRSEPTPSQNFQEGRPMRTGLMAKYFSERGHDVIFWTSTFNHTKKIQRYNCNKKEKINDKYYIQYLHAPSYKKNISFKRVINNYLVANAFSKISNNYITERPDVIIASMPSVELALKGVEYAKKNNVPIYIDIRDLWPDIFFDVTPKIIHPFVSVLAYIMNKNLKKVLESADGIFSLTESYLSWGLKKIDRNRSIKDKVFPFGYVKQEYLKNEKFDDFSFWENLNIMKKSEYLIITFIGSLGRMNDLAPIIEAAKILLNKNIKVKFVICGSGENENIIKNAALEIDNFIYAGFINQIQIYQLMSFSDIGLLPYLKSINYYKNIPNKPSEYLSSGLALALSLDKGEMYDLIKKNNIGFSYNFSGIQLAEKILKLSRKRNDLALLKKNALYIFKNDFDADNIYNNIIEFLEINYKKNDKK